MTDLTWVLSSCVLIGVVIAVRAAFGKRMRPELRYALWGLVLLRLLIPAQLFTAPWGVSAELPEQTAERQIYVLPVEETKVPGRFEISDEPYPEEIMQVWNDNNTRFTGVDGDMWTFTRYAASGSVEDVLRAVWLAGAGVMTAAFLLSNLRFYARLRRRRTPLETDCPLRVYSVENLSSSCLFGSAVYVAAETAADETRLRHVLAHELSHHRHGDHIWALLRCAALALHWYNPLVWWAAVLSRQDSELCADAGALKRLGEEERGNYGATLIELSARRAARAPLLCTATTMTNGKRSLRERVTMIARRPRMTAAAVLAVVTIAVLAGAFAFAGAKEDAPAVAADEEQGEQLARCASVEDYLDSVRAAMTTATYYAADGSGERTANVLDTRVAFLEKDGELSGLAPGGTLELYNYGIETKIDVPLENVALVGGMYDTEDGWCDLEGQGGHSLVVLRRADGSVDALFDHFNNDDRGGLSYYEESAEEMLYDFYVKKKGLDLPLYTVELLPADETGNYPARRWDGDGWYVYIPVQAWSEDSSGGTARWVSQYGTGSSISIRQSSHEEMAAERPQLTEGQAERFVEAPDGRIWLVWTQYDPAKITDYPPIAREPRVLAAMAERFTVVAAAPLSSTLDTQALLSAIAGEYWFLSGAGGWHSELHLNGDGSFTGKHQDSDADTVYYCSFSGQFGDIQPVDRYTYSMRLLELNCEQAEEQNLGTREGIRYIGSSPYGMENTEEFLVYLPNTPVTSLSEEYRSWYDTGFSWAKPYSGTLDTIGLCNAAQQYGWFPAKLIGMDAASRIRTLLDMVCAADGSGEPITLRLYSAYGDSAVESVGSEDARTCGNFRFYMNYLFRSTDVSFEPAELPALNGNCIELTILSMGDRLLFREGTNDLLWTDRGGTERSFRMVYAAGDTVAGDLVRDWYDEAEYNALGGDDRKQSEILIPDRGQTWLEAAQEFCERFESIHLQATPGSKYKYTFVRPVAEAAEDQTAHFRSIGHIDEDTWCFYLATAFVPENERALNWSMAGNTGDYAGSDPDVPAGAYEYYRCGYAHRVPEGWRCEIVGTGW